ncbi:AAA family ATPase [Calothrix sp. NIES-2098]|uniref:AAA family ATPase n=1 Tax=Calothrix sp. NIES-2098 TaxID=1954171 RepID=UPI000B605439|nr:hypothetical protein NIES2098_61850 [Calothrix sp. NIES-2098]
MLMETTSIHNNFLSDRNTAIEWLSQHGYPALPVAPKQDPFKYPKRDKNGNIEYEEDGKTPKPKFTGKNPSYLDENNEPHLVFHSNYQNSLPTQSERDKWFANTLNGVGTLGGWNKTVWIDFDVKNFDSQQECDRLVSDWLNRYSVLKETFIELTHSGGWRIGIRVRKMPEFTNFTLSPGGKHVGECLGKGRFTVLSPTIGPSGNQYQSINRAKLVEVEDLESIGLYSTKKQASTKLQSSLIQLDLAPHAIPLEEFFSEKPKDILNGTNPNGDRSEALTTLAKEAFGWQNWCFDNGISTSGDAENIVELAGKKLRIDSDRIQRILKTIDSSSCQPSAQYLGGEESCWLKIRRLDKGTFEAKCPAAIKLEIENNLTTDVINTSKSSNNNKNVQHKISRDEAIKRARKVINAGLDELEENLQLEEIREQAGLSSYFWERKVITNLRRESLPTRLTLEIEAFLCETNPQKQIIERSRILSRYQISAKEFEQQCQAIQYAEKQTQKKPRLLALSEVFASEGKAFQWQVEGIIPKGVSGMLSGLPGASKTLLTVDLAYCIVTGTPFLGEKVKPGKVLIINSDQPLNVTANYLSSRGFDDNDANIKVIGELHEMAAWTINDLVLLESYLQEFQPDLVIIDSIRATIINPLGIEEKSELIGYWLKKVERLVIKYSATLLWVHHDNKQKDYTGVSRASGSTAIAGSVSFHYRIEKVSKDQSDPHRILSMAKTRGYEPVTLKLMYDSTTGIFQNMGHEGESPETARERQSLRQRIMEFLERNPGQKYELEEIQAAVGGENVGVELSKMSRRGMIANEKSLKNPRKKVYFVESTQPPPSQVTPTSGS